MTTTTEAGSVQYELTVCTATGLTPAQFGSPLMKPKFFVSVQDGANTLFQTPTSERTYTPKWSKAHVLSVPPNRPLKLELFRDSLVHSDRSFGSFETTMGQLELQTGKDITCILSDSIGLTLRCRRLDKSPSTESESQIQFVRARGSGPTPEPRLRTAPSPAVATTAQKNEINYGAGLRTFALVIGIDEYSSSNKPRLQGAARDARKMDELLRTTFGVPGSHIRLLCNQDATRNRILDEFQALSTNKNIQKGDAIIIFFAGHGSRAPAPPEWMVEGGMVETICPVDEEFKGGSSEIHGIPDRTLGALVSKLSQVKGNNITLIFDCCHSGGIARGDEPEEPCRTAKTTSQLPRNLDQDIWGDLPLARGGSQKKGFSASLSSYVLLAACRPEEQAMETLVEGEARGAFSTALFRHLRRSNSGATYSKLLQNVARELESNSHPQHPVCEGDRRDCQMFDGLATRRDGKLFAVTADEGSYTVNAGAIHGVAERSRFALRRLDTTSGAYLEVGFLQVKTVSTGFSVVEPVAGSSFVITEDCMAFVEDWGDSEHLLDVSPDALRATWMQPSVCRPRYRTTPAASQRALVLREATGGQMSFQRGSPIAEHTKEHLRPPFTFTPWTLQHALNSIGDFHFHLGRKNPKVSSTLKDTVKLGIHKIESGTKAENLLGDGRVVVQPGIDFFFTITNESPHDIYPYLFYFDPTDYSIQSWYYPVQQNGRAPLIARKDSEPPTLLRVGFGGDSFDFTIPDGATSDLGFVKLFVSTCEVDMDSLVQESPFKAGKDEQAGMARGGRKKGGPKQADSWDSYCCTVDIRQLI